MTGALMNLFYKEVRKRCVKEDSSLCDFNKKSKEKKKRTIVYKQHGLVESCGYHPTSHALLNGFKNGFKKSPSRRA